MATVKKLDAAVDRSGHFGRNAMGLGGRTPATWGVFHGGTHVATVRLCGRFWEVHQAWAPFLRLAPKGFPTRAAACQWAVENL